MQLQTDSDYRIVSDKVYAAMESGNFSQARLVLKEYEETIPDITRRVAREVQVDYGVRL